MKDAHDVMGSKIAWHPLRFALEICIRACGSHIDESDRPQARGEKIGPFPIISSPPAMSFTLRLPSTVRIDPVFYMSQLEPDYPILSMTVISSRLPHLSSTGNPNI